MPTELTSEPTIPSIATEEDLAVARPFPLDAYSLGGDQVATIRYAADLLAADCMARQGFTMRPTRPNTTPDAPVRNRLVVMFGVGVLSEVKQYGYDELPQYVGTQKPTSPADDFSVQQSEEYLIALMGPPEDRPALPPIDVGGGFQASGSTFSSNSCLGEAYAVLSVADSRRVVIGGGSGLVARLDSDSRAAAESDARVIDMIKSWSTCMASRGFPAANPSEAANTYGPGDKQLAIAAATADVECKDLHNFFGVMYGVLVAYQEAAIESNAQALAALAEENEEVLSNVSAVLQDS